jgi:hypothetical protein
MRSSISRQAIAALGSGRVTHRNATMNTASMTLLPPIVSHKLGAAVINLSRL